MPSRRQFLKSGAAVAAGVSVAGCIFTVDTVDSLPRPFLGATADSDVPVIQAFEDFRCPHCRQFTLNEFPQLKSQYIDSNQIRFEWYDFPLPVDDLSRPAAVAARSVQDNAGMDAFWAVQKALFEEQDSIGSLPDVARVCAQNADVDADTVLQDARQGVYGPVVQADINKGESLNVTATPTIFVDGVQVDPTFESIQSALNLDNDSSGNETT